MKVKLLSGLLAAALMPGVSAAVAAIEHKGTPKDLGVVNQERILYWMEKRGELSPHASDAEKAAALNEYLPGAKNNKPLPKIVQNSLQHKHDAYKQSGVKLLKNNQNTTVKVLAVLVDFPDLKHDNNGLSSGDTDMYYSSYPVSHYQDLMFSTSGFTGPGNQNLTSGYQYYQNESGGTFNFTGDTYGWVTADNNADHYGANDPDNNDDDINVPALIKEAVTKAVNANNINLADYDLEDPYDLDGDGVIEEADGLIDHVMVYHSSIGEEAGGGNLAEDAIWSHRFYVDTGTTGYTIPGTNKRLFGYTIQPIDAATGVVVHEFGHDLGLPDEYDTSGSDAGSPVAYWSVMAGGSWAGSLSGTEPTGFSPYARAFLQSTYGGNWINEQAIDFESLSAGTTQDVNLVEAVNHDSGINQLRIDMPKPLVDFDPPYAGSYQYYSDEGHYMDNSLSFDVSVPNSGVSEMTMKARWEIEIDYDYAQVLVNGTAIAGNHTKVNNQYHSVTNFITGKSADIAGAEGALGWVDLTFDLSAYAGQDISITIQYVTDPSVGGYGIVVDNLSISNDSTFYSDDAETADVAALDGFVRVGDSKPGKAQNYWVQLRSENGQDAGLAGTIYSPGVLVWFADEAYSDNKVSDADHPGHGFIGVVDVDQDPIMRNGSIASSTLQVIDAALSLYNQKNYAGDSDQTPKSLFDDSEDYSFPQQPASGLVLPVNGLTIELLNQAANNTTATVQISKASSELAADFNYAINFREVSFDNATGGGDAGYTYAWDFGDGSVSTEENPVHTYAASGDYTVSLTVTDGAATVDTVSQTVSIAEPLTAMINSTVNGANVSVSAETTGGASDYTYNWDFGDGNSATGQNAEHSYSLSGLYTVTLVVTSGDGQESEVTEDVEVVVPLNANFTSSRNDLTVNFSSSASGGDGAYTYEWDFGDSSTSNSSSPSHTYSAAGTYTVELTVTDGQDVSTTVSKSVTVTEPSSGGGGGGGSTSLWLLALLSTLMFVRRKDQ